MERTITVRSSALDRWARKLRALEMEKEKELGIQDPLVSAILISPALDQNRLGYFRYTSRLIVISEELVESGREDDIINVFLHELSHALDYRLFGALEHGATFHTCCRMLGVEEGFDKSTIRLSVKKGNAKREKIRKLMALSASPFENESAIAIQKAKEMMAEGGAGLYDDERIYTAALYSAGRFSYGIKMLLNYIEKTSGVFLITSNEGGTKKALVYGSLEEVEFSIYLFDYLESSVKAEIQALRSKGDKVSRDNFIMGMIEALSSKTEGSSADKAIIAIQSKNMDAAKRIVYPESRFSRRVSHSYISFDKDSYGHGKGFGDNLSVPASIGRKALT